MALVHAEICFSLFCFMLLLPCTSPRTNVNHPRSRSANQQFLLSFFIHLAPSANGAHFLLPRTFGLRRTSNTLHNWYITTYYVWLPLATLIDVENHPLCIYIYIYTVIPKTIPKYPQMVVLHSYVGLTQVVIPSDCHH